MDPLPILAFKLDCLSFLNLFCLLSTWTKRMRIIKMEKTIIASYIHLSEAMLHIYQILLFFSHAPQDNDSLSLFAGWLALMMEVCPRLCEQTTKVIWDSSWDLLYNSPCLLYTCFSTLRVKWWMLLVTNKKKKKPWGSCINVRPTAHHWLNQMQIWQYSLCFILLSLVCSG